MANVHTLSDLNNNNAGGRNGGAGGFNPQYAPLAQGAGPGAALDPEALEAVKMYSGLQGGAGV